VRRAEATKARPAQIRPAPAGAAKLCGSNRSGTKYDNLPNYNICPPPIAEMISAT